MGEAAGSLSIPGSPSDIWSTGDLRVENNIIAYNVADDAGGGLYTDAVCTVIGNDFVGNTAKSAGAACRLTKATLAGNRFIGNVVEEGANGAVSVYLYVNLRHEDGRLLPLPDTRNFYQDNEPQDVFFDAYI